MVNKLINSLLVVSILFLLFSCKEKMAEVSSKENGPISEITDEEYLYRPNLHFSPNKNWVNDPNGMFYYNGYYHLYFQHHPDGNTWGPMHWGHAVSTDMISWKEMPIAIYPDDLGDIWSGSAVVDIENTAGFQKSNGSIPIIAMYTNAKKLKEGEPWKQTQSIAYSLDEGKTWVKYEDNPVIEDPDIKEFRDPKVTWDEERNRWLMVLAAGDRIIFYSSKNLKDWTRLSDFGGDLSKDIGAHGGVWECPDLFPLTVAGTDVTKWVLIVSINPGGPNGGSATQYFIGDFDGTNFKMDNSFEAQLNKEHTFWIDFGRDNYAGVTWSNISGQNGEKFFIGWMSNWDYANQVPTEGWRNAMTIARKLELINDVNTYRMVSRPVEELLNYRGVKYKKDEIKIQGEIPLLDSKRIDLTKAEIRFEIPDLSNNNYKFKLTNKKGDELYYGYDGQARTFYLDRTSSGKVDFSDKFSNKISIASRSSQKNSLHATVLLDKTSIELFFDDGETVMTEIFFPNAPFETLSAISENGEFIIKQLEIHELKIN